MTVVTDHKANPEPLKLFNSLKILISNLTSSDNAFATEVSQMYRSTQIKTTCTDKALLEFMGLLRAREEGKAKEGPGMEEKEKRGLSVRSISQTKDVLRVTSVLMLTPGRLGSVQTGLDVVSRMFRNLSEPRRFIEFHGDMVCTFTSMNSGESLSQMLENEALVALGRPKCWETKHWCRFEGQNNEKIFCL